MGNRPFTGQIVKCFTCGEEIYKPACLLKERNYCSMNCLQISPYKRKKSSERMKKNPLMRMRGVSEKRTKTFLANKHTAWNKGLKMGELYPHIGFQKGHKFYNGGERGWFKQGQTNGEKNKNWKGGITPITNIRVNAVGWKRLRKQIYTRDNWTCQKCGKHGGVLQCHHIIPWRKTQDDSEKNLITLCRSCHTKIDGGLLKCS